VEKIFSALIFHGSFISAGVESLLETVLEILGSRQQRRKDNAHNY